jgi:excisionase family DNA binding protein
MPDREEIDAEVPSLIPLAEKILLSRREAAAVLSISLRTIDNMVSAGTIPVVRINRRILFRRLALEAWAEQRETNCEEAECPASPNAETDVS